MSLENFLGEFGNQTGMGNLSLDDNNVCRLIFDQEHMVDIEQLDEKGTFFLHASLCAVPAQDREHFLTELMAANLFGQETFTIRMGFNPIQ